MEKRKILIFGGNGFIGSQLAKYYSLLGLHVEAYSSVSCNLLDFNAVKKVLENTQTNTCVINAATKSHRGNHNSLDSIKNIEMIANVIENCKTHKIQHLIQLSSMDVYGTPPPPNISMNS